MVPVSVAAQWGYGGIVAALARRSVRVDMMAADGDPRPRGFIVTESLPGGACLHCIYVREVDRRKGWAKIAIAERLSGPWAWTSRNTWFVALARGYFPESFYSPFPWSSRVPPDAWKTWDSSHYHRRAFMTAASDAMLGKLV
jgi:hypothetical protein